MCHPKRAETRNQKLQTRASDASDAYIYIYMWRAGQNEAYHDGSGRSSVTIMLGHPSLRWICTWSFLDPDNPPSEAVLAV